MSSDGPRPKTFDVNYDRYKKSKREEDRIAEKLGGRRLPRSGGLSWSSSDPVTDRGDLVSPHLLIEHKRVEPHIKSIGIKRAWLQKVTKGAYRKGGRIPGMVVSFEDPSGHDRDWLLLPLDAAQRLMGVHLEEPDDDEG